MTATAQAPGNNSVLTITREERIHQAVDKGVTGNLAVNLSSGGASFRDMAEVCEFSKLMALSMQAVPPHCREQPGVCLAMTLQSIEWRMSPFAVANKSYVVNDRISYESQLIHAVIEQRAPIVGRLRHEFFGDGNKRTCRVWAKERETGEELTYTSPEIGTITPKNSPLWKSKPDLQLFYNTSRDWARVYYPDVIMGVYSDEEMAGIVNVDARSPAPKTLNDLTQRLAAPKSEEPKDYVTPDGSDPADSVPPEAAVEPQQTPTNRPPRQDPEPEPEATEAPSDYAGTICNVLRRAVAQKDLAAVNRTYDEHFDEYSTWEPTSDAQRDAIRNACESARAALANPSARATQKTAFNTADHA